MFFCKYITFFSEDLRGVLPRPVSAASRRLTEMRIALPEVTNSCPENENIDSGAIYVKKKIQVLIFWSLGIKAKAH